MLEFLKIMVQPVLLERDEDGKIIGEKIGEMKAIYDENTLLEFVNNLKVSIAQANELVMEVEETDAGR